MVGRSRRKAEGCKAARLQILKIQVESFLSDRRATQLTDRIVKTASKALLMPCIGKSAGSADVALDRTPAACLPACLYEHLLMWQPHPSGHAAQFWSSSCSSGSIQQVGDCFPDWCTIAYSLWCSIFGRSQPLDRFNSSSRVAG